MEKSPAIQAKLSMALTSQKCWNLSNTRVSTSIQLCHSQTMVKTYLFHTLLSKLQSHLERKWCSIQHSCVIIIDIPHISNDTLWVMWKTKEAYSVLTANICKPASPYSFRCLLVPLSYDHPHFWQSTKDDNTQEKNRLKHLRCKIIKSIFNPLTLNDLRTSINVFHCMIQMHQQSKQYHPDRVSQTYLSSPLQRRITCSLSSCTITEFSSFSCRMPIDWESWIPRNARND